MSMTQSRMVRKLVSSQQEAEEAVKNMNLNFTVEVLSYPLARQPWASQKFKAIVATPRDLSEAVEKAIQASIIGKALLVGWPIYKT